jgi:type I restriction enzyme M protein
MDEDVHGRIFEEFLDATTRGRELGQFFTPRDVVKLIVELADIQVGKKHIDKVLDACCGSGGFLISAMDSMIRKANRITGTTDAEKDRIIKSIRNECIFGIDAGSDPAIYRIARMNMYLHGDGGTHIYFADSLDKSFGEAQATDYEDNNQLDELKGLVLKDKLKFDIILSNPPFSLKYSRDDEYQATVLKDYEVSTDRKDGKILKSLLSSVMFIERYKDLIANDGVIFAIVDESVLSGQSYSHVRHYIRQNFIVRGVISLPGDAFQRAAARVKTSVLILSLKKENEQQTDVFLATTTYVGLEDKVAKRIGIDTKLLSAKKDQERNKLIAKFKEFLDGHANEYVYPSAHINNRLDPKYCINDRSRQISHWDKKGHDAINLGSALSIASGRREKVKFDKTYILLKVNYDGEVLEGDSKLGSESSYKYLYKTNTWDILYSNMGISRGAIGIVPPYQSGRYVSNEYTILSANSKAEAIYYTQVIRSKEMLGDILSASTGMNRGRIKWDDIREIAVPQYVDDHGIESLAEQMEELWVSYQKYKNHETKQISEIYTRLNINSDAAVERWLGFKPPE